MEAARALRRKALPIQNPVWEAGTLVRLRSQEEREEIGELLFGQLVFGVFGLGAIVGHWDAVLPVPAYGAARALLDVRVRIHE